jgi:hypothetical protein
MHSVTAKQLRQGENGRSSNADMNVWCERGSGVKIPKEKRFSITLWKVFVRRIG